MNTLMAVGQNAALPKRERRFYFWVASTILALIAFVIYLLVPASDFVSWPVLALGIAYVISWAGILLGKPLRTG